jgi:hypothetical protein
MTIPKRALSPDHVERAERELRTLIGSLRPNFHVVVEPGARVDHLTARWTSRGRTMGQILNWPRELYATARLELYQACLRHPDIAEARQPSLFDEEAA